MSVQSDTSQIQYTGNGSAVTPYPVPFVFLEATHLHVIITDPDGTETELTLGAEYTVSGAGSSNGGNVTTKTAVSGTKKVTIYREVPAVQQYKFTENDAFPSRAVEKALDSLTMICQQLSRKVERCFRVSDASPALVGLEASSLDANSVFISGEDRSLHLWSVKRLKEEISAMAAVPALINYLQVLYPVGCLYFTRRTENPRDILGFGTWERYGSGRMIVSLDPGNEALSVVGATGGEATHTLTEAEMPEHDHPVLEQTITGGTHKHTIAPPATETGSAGAHTHTVATQGNSGFGGGGIATGDNSANSTRETSEAEAHTHTVEITPFETESGGDHSHTVPEQNTQAVGGGAAHNNMPPYIVVNVWTRINSDAPEEGVGTLPFPADPTLLVDRVTGATRKIVVDDTVIGTVSVE